MVDNDLTSFEQEFIQEFLQIYKENPCVWKVTSENFADREKRKDAYKLLLAKFKEKDESADETSIKEVISKIKNNFRIEHEIYKEAVKAGNKDFEPSFFYQELSKFVDENDYPRRGLSNIFIPNFSIEESKVIKSSKQETKKKKMTPSYSQNNNEAKRILETDPTLCESDSNEDLIIQHDESEDFYPPSKRLCTERPDNNLFDLAYKKISNSKHLKSMRGIPQKALKEHDQFGLSIAQDLRALNSSVFAKMAQQKILEAVYKVQLTAFGYIRSMKAKYDEYSPELIKSKIAHQIEKHSQDALTSKATNTTLLQQVLKEHNTCNSSQKPSASVDGQQKLLVMPAISTSSITPIPATIMTSEALIKSLNSLSEKVNQNMASSSTVTNPNLANVDSPFESVLIKEEPTENES